MGWGNKFLPGGWQLSTAAIVLLAAGCTSTEDTIRPLSADVNEMAQAQPAPLRSAGVATAPKSIRFAPIIGAPIGRITPLSKQLAQEARSRGFSVHPSSDARGDHLLKGYLSAFNDGAVTTVVFVWDILDPAGNRLHRIQGQERVDGAADEAWEAVPDSSMQRIASRLFDEYQQWLQRSPAG
ncbi:hypothetical protein [Pseudohoeflea coraliihabitans]|uniref:Lipoprotein n=1 Tax=Pseudohoeflea coraliihabitans TaxID=2860393 RepID=A0ABS6WKZ6_9HYPH|nr:hypothetical protein [Pseudohoeflea sp. DP4N28-3]MBW3096102.1 hypothetical protein [Pseudohoeflea sp. DP4N28-3]